VGAGARIPRRASPGSGASSARVEERPLGCHDVPSNEAALADGRWQCAAAPLANPRWPAITIEFYTVIVCAAAGAKEALDTALAALARGEAPEAPDRVAHLERRASGRRHSAIIEAGGGS